jgi:hypothetical protein
MLAGMALMLATTPFNAALAVDAPTTAPGKTQPAEWTDSMFSQPFIDVDEWRDKPVRHRYVHGGFGGTQTLFSFYFPTKEQYQGRFFQPVAAYGGNENAAQQGAMLTNSPVTQENMSIGFAVASGGYLVETNNGVKFAGGQSQDPNVNTVIGYRANAAAAQYSRVLAAQMYGPHRPYGYIYGGSGGSLKTVCGFENTMNVWDGALPYVYGTPMAMPNVFTISAYAERVLKNKFPAITDALDPGGSGDMYAGLNQEERDVLRETNRMGVPPRIWFAYKRLGYGPLASLINELIKFDPQYFDDFWNVPGYLGANPPESLKRARIQQKTTITRMVMSDEARKMGIPVPPMARGEGGTAVVPTAIQVKNMPKGDLLGASLIFQSGGASGQRISVAGVVGDLITLGIPEDAFPSMKSVKVGDEIQIDNSIYLAAQTYHRHQVPTPDFYIFDQFRGPDGNPIYPQRPRIVGPDYARGNGGCAVHSGWIRFPGKLIMVESLVDEYAHPWSADWFRSRVKEKMGSHLDDVFRLYYVDNAMHGQPPPGPDRTRIVQYTTVLQQALRDLAAWVEKGVPPPSSTNYKIVDSQVEVPATAAERRGIQPVVTVTVNGGARADVAVGQPVTFSGVIEVPPHTGKVVEAEWDFEGAGDYPVPGQLQTDASGARATVTATHSFSKTGTYFPALRAASQRQPDNTSYARIENLGRVRVVVK